MKRFLFLLALLTAQAQAQVTTLQIVNARAGELDPIPGGSAQDRVTFQGNAVDGWQTKIAAIRIDRVYPWTTPPTRTGFAKTEVVATCPLEADGSLRCIFACGIDYQLRGIDAVGNVVASDETLHHAFCGEIRTCAGCHSEHAQEVVDQIKIPLADRWAATIAGKKPAPPGC